VQAITPQTGTGFIHQFALEWQACSNCKLLSDPDTIQVSHPEHMQSF